MLTSLPTWILVRILLKFVPTEHMWYGQKFTMLDWHEHETDITRAFDVILWIHVFAILSLIAMN